MILYPENTMQRPGHRIVLAEGNVGAYKKSMAEPEEKRYVLTLSCQDVIGIVAAVATFLRDHGGFILESAQYGDLSTGRFFMRTEFRAGEHTPELESLHTAFEREVAGPFAMDWHLYDRSRKTRMLVMVSRHGHCLNDLLHRYQSKQLQVEIPAVVSNHPDFQALVDWHGIPFHHLPVSAESRHKQEADILTLIEDHRIDLVVLARYMQILSPELCQHLAGRCINIHHSFLPSFKGANPYRQAHERGVKIIGATSHYVTPDLDEGPIIEQEIERVDHTYSANALIEVGRDIESRVLARAVRYHTEHRVLQNGHKTVVFR